MQFVIHCYQSEQETNWIAGSYTYGALPWLLRRFLEGGGVSNRQEAFIWGGASYTNFAPQEERLLGTRRLFESGHLLDHLRCNPFTEDPL